MASKNNKNCSKLFELKNKNIDLAKCRSCFNTIGPPKIPWLGSYIFLLLLDRKHLHRAANRLCRWYKSTVIGFHHGSDPIIVVNDLKSLKEMFNNRDFDGRPEILMGQLRHPTFEMYGG